MIDVRLLERIVRPAPIGIRFRDAGTGDTVSDGLAVTVTAIGNPGRAVTLEVNRSGIWYARRVPGIGDAPEPPRAYRIDARDRLGRFLPLSTTVMLPADGLVVWPDWETLPSDPLAPLFGTGLGSPPFVADFLPLFPAPAAAAPGPVAEIRLQLALATTGTPASWALVTAAHAGRVRAIGQADAEGRAVLFFPYPERPRSSVFQSPPEITDFAWPTTIAAYWNDLPADRAPDLASLMAQLDHRRDLFESTAAPQRLLGEQALTFSRPLTLRTGQTPEGPSSLLMMAAA